MRPLDLSRVRHAVIVAPHPDDEAIGAYTLIHWLRHAGARVRVIVVTDGTGSHPGSKRWPAARLAALRQRESLAVLARLGVERRAVTFLGLTDGALPAMGARDRLALRRAIVAPQGCDLLILPTRDDDHPDHRAVAAACTRLPVRRQFDYLVWPNRRSASRRASHCLRGGALTPAKRGAILRYRSQVGMITDDPAGFTISTAELAAFARGVEHFRETRR